MDVTFDGANKLIILNAGTVEMNVQELYSLWKDWMTQSDNAKYLPAISVVGGEPTVGQNKITPYFFMQNGWKIRPQEADHTLVVEGTLIPEAGEELFVATLGVYRISIQSVVPIYTETINTGSGLSSEEREWVKQTNNNAKLIPAIIE